MDENDFMCKWTNESAALSVFPTIPSGPFQEFQTDSLTALAEATYLVKVFMCICPVTDWSSNAFPAAAYPG